MRHKPYPKYMLTLCLTLKTYQLLIRTKPHKIIGSLISVLPCIFWTFRSMLYQFCSLMLYICKIYLRLPTTSGQLCVSIGNDSRCMGQLAIMVNLQHKFIIVTNVVQYMLHSELMMKHAFALHGRIANKIQTFLSNTISNQ